MYSPSKLLFIMILASFSFSSALGQDDSSDDERSDLQVSTGIGFGLTGPKYFTKFQLADELGMAYDVMSLLEDDFVRTTVQLSERQLAEIRNLNEAVTSELTGQLSQVLIFDEGQEQIESRFRALEIELRTMMSPDQVARLELAKNQKGIERFGISKFLASNAMKKELGFSDGQLERFVSQANQSKSEHEKHVESLRRQANQKLLAELDKVEREKINRILEGESMEAFLNSGLLVEGKSLRRRKPSRQRALLSTLRLGTTRSELDLDGSQYERAMQLKKDRNRDEDSIRKGLEEILTATQVGQLNKLGALAETSRYGTVNAVSFGLLGNLVGLTPDDSERIYDAGKEIAADLEKEISRSKSESQHKSLTSLTKEQREKVVAMLGD